MVLFGTFIDAASLGYRFRDLCCGVRGEDADERENALKDDAQTSREAP